MKIHTLSDEVSVCGQLQASDVEHIVADGFQSLICNRPDGEAANQDAFHVIAQKAESCGLQTRYIPVQAIDAADATTFGDALAELPKPVLAYCRTGTRSTNLWALSQQQQGAGIEDIITTASNAGYDVRDVLT